MDFPVTLPPKLGTDTWADVPGLFRRSANPLPQPWEDFFGPLRGQPGETVVIGQIGQSLDGRIATPTGHSHYINGEAGLAHLHRLRALVDAVVVGVGTALADDPQLTVRRVSGPDPVRVVIDPAGRLPASARLFAADGGRRLIVTSSDADVVPPPGVEALRLPRSEGRIEPAAIVAALSDCGLRRVLIEGGADTVSRFLAAGCLDRLHVVVAPIILGSGRVGLNLPPIERADQALRVPVQTHRLGDEVLFDFDLSAQPDGRAKKST
jgi:diaminohydroxyphosphoribosylaminopyrimidine deaminase/5-amino-6-(5-phosphoribosylamino)uracil reductase